LETNYSLLNPDISYDCLPRGRLRLLHTWLSACAAVPNCRHSISRCCWHRSWRIYCNKIE